MHGVVGPQTTPHSGLCKSIPVYIGGIHEELYGQRPIPYNLVPFQNGASAVTAISGEISNLLECVGIIDAIIYRSFFSYYKAPAPLRNETEICSAICLS